MNIKSIILLLIAIICVAIIHSCNSSNKINGEQRVKTYFYRHTDSLLHALTMLDSAVIKKENINELKDLFTRCRFVYKKKEAITEYYFQGITKRINGPALPDVKTEDGQVWPPHGFQVIEQFLYSNYHDSLAIAVSAEIKLLQTDLRFVKTNIEHQAILPQHIQEMMQHQLIRIAALGITGFDAPISKLSLAEAKESLAGLGEILLVYQPADKAVEPLFQNAIAYLSANNDFDSFNRLEFLTAYLVPLSENVYSMTAYKNGSESAMVKPFKGSLVDWISGKGWNADYYAAYANAATNADKLLLGKKLFFDKQLSRSGTISCASCHQPDLFFTDGKTKAGDFVHGGSLLRNTPSLYYTALQSHQFYDLRSVTLEDQAHEVMKSSSEFDFSATAIAKKNFSDSAYASLFRKAFAVADTISGYQVRNAIAAFVRSLSPFSSRFDEYVQGNRQALSEEEIRGFNLFAGKAKCGTCHFMPLFNGNIPPWYSKSESEIIGVPAKIRWTNAVIDDDSGRYRINRMDELLYAFKTPGIRNAEKTAPYMHNGVYNTLDEVVEFYHKGGGVGIGINLPFQSLPFDSLSLNTTEKKAIVAFMKSLTDKKTDY